MLGPGECIPLLLCPRNAWSKTPREQVLTGTDALVAPRGERSTQKERKRGRANCKPPRNSNKVYHKGFVFYPRGGACELPVIHFSQVTGPPLQIFAGLIFRAVGAKFTDFSDIEGELSEIAKIRPVLCEVRKQPERLGHKNATFRTKFGYTED